MTKAGHKMSPFSVFLLGVDSMIGSAAFLLPGSLYAKAGIMIIPILILSGISALLLALCYAGLASRTSGNGAGWLYAYNEFGQFAGFEVGLFTWLQGVMTIATEIAAFLTALQVFFPQLHHPGTYRITGILVILAISVIGILGQRVSNAANDTATLLKLAVLILFIIGGIWFIHGAHLLHSPVYSFASYNNAYSNVFYMYTGFAFLPVAATEMRNPQKNLPRELLAVITAVVTLYVVVFVVVIGMLGRRIATSSAPLALAFAARFGFWGKLIITVGTIGSILGVAISLSYSTPFVASSLANEHKLLPAFFGIKTKNGAPWVAILLTAGVCALLFLSGNYLFLVPCAVIVSLVQYFSTALVMLRVKWRQHQHKEPAHTGFHLHGGITVPVLALIVCGYILVNLQWRVIVFGALLLAAGILLYVGDTAVQRWRHRHA